MGKIFKLNTEDCSTELQTKSNFDNVTENKKPESGNSGFNYKSLDPAGSGNGKSTDSSLPDAPNLYKTNGVSMENSGYFSFPRPISNDPRYKGARIKYKHVLHIILENAVFRETTHSIGTEQIEVKIGQFCITVRGLVDLCNKGVRFKDDMVDKNIVERASHFWQTCGFVRQEVRHGKILLTVTVPEFYVREKNESETTSETKPRLNRDIKETLETQETLIEDTNVSSSANASDSAIAPSEKKKVSSSSSKRRKKVEPVPLIERDIGIFTSDIAHQKLIQEKGSEEVVKQIYSAMAVWKSQNGISAGDDYKTAMKWSLAPKKPPSRFPNQKPNNQPKYNHDTSPRNPKNHISFAEEV